MIPLFYSGYKVFIEYQICALLSKLFLSFRSESFHHYLVRLINTPANEK